MALTDDQLLQLSFDFFNHRGNSWRDQFVSTSITPKGLDVGVALINYARAAIALAEGQEPIPY
jgi:hypothetical protein